MPSSDETSAASAVKGDRRRRRASSQKPSFPVAKKNALKTRRLVPPSSSSSEASSKRRSLSPPEAMEELLRGYMEDADLMLGKLKSRAETAAHNAEELAKDVYVKLTNWKAIHFEKLPSWMKDNEHLHFGHRPELPSFDECFRSIFRIHTETGNIWTHLIGFVAFVIVTIVFYVQPLCATCKLDIQLSEKLVFLAFFIGAILCLACSTLFHTVSCHSEWVSAVFSRLDYAGIAVLIVGSVIPWLYYGFYCQFYARLTYMIAVAVVGLLTIVLTMWEKFNQPEYRTTRAAVFVSLALICSLPVFHYLIENGFHTSTVEASMHWMILMGALYITGAVLYAARIPERFLPGKCDIWFQSHQIFHVLVIVAAFVHYHGIQEMAVYRLTKLGNNCDVPGGAGAVVDPDMTSAQVF